MSQGTYNMHCPILRSGHNPARLPIICGDVDDNWKIRVAGVDRWFTPIVAGEHDGYEHEQPIVRIDGRDYRVGLCWAVRL
jgi:hypothetical protein